MTRTSKSKSPAVLISSHSRFLRVPRKKIAALVAFVARAEGHALGQVDIAVVDSAQIAAMNRRYLNHRGATDVLSFDLSGADGAAAQIVVCGQIAARQAQRLGGGKQRELLLYVTHGLLHLMGYDDTTPTAAKKMHARQEKLLEKFLAKTRKKESGEFEVGMPY